MIGYDPHRQSARAQVPWSNCLYVLERGSARMMERPSCDNLRTHRTEIKTSTREIGSGSDIQRNGER